MNTKAEESIVSFCILLLSFCHPRYTSKSGDCNGTHDHDWSTFGLGMVELGIRTKFKSAYGDLSGNQGANRLQRIVACYQGKTPMLNHHFLLPRKINTSHQKSCGDWTERERFLVGSAGETLTEMEVNHGPWCPTFGKPNIPKLSLSVNSEALQLRSVLWKTSSEGNDHKHVWKRMQNEVAEARNVSRGTVSWPQPLWPRGRRLHVRPYVHDNEEWFHEVSSKIAIETEILVKVICRDSAVVAWEMNPESDKANTAEARIGRHLRCSAFVAIARY